MQDIVLRSPTLDYLSAVSSCSYSGTGPDGFGGAAVVISADEIIGLVLMQQRDRMNERGDAR